MPASTTPGSVDQSTCLATGCTATTKRTKCPPMRRKRARQYQVLMMAPHTHIVAMEKRIASRTFMIRKSEDTPRQPCNPAIQPSGIRIRI